MLAVLMLTSRLHAASHKAIPRRTMRYRKDGFILQHSFTNTGGLAPTMVEWTGGVAQWEATVAR